MKALTLLKIFTSFAVFLNSVSAYILENGTKIPKIILENGTNVSAYIKFFSDLSGRVGKGLPNLSGLGAAQLTDPRFEQQTFRVWEQDQP